MVSENLVQFALGVTGETEITATFNKLNRSLESLSMKLAQANKPTHFKGLSKDLKEVVSEANRLSAFKSINLIDPKRLEAANTLLSQALSLIKQVNKAQSDNARLEAARKRRSEASTKRANAVYDSDYMEAYHLEAKRRTEMKDFYAKRNDMVNPYQYVVKQNDNGYGLVLDKIKKSNYEMAKLNYAYDQAHKRIGLMAKNWSILTRVISVSVGYKAFYGLTNSLAGAVEKAQQLSRAVAEIKTISQSDTSTSQQWQNDIVALSNKYGIGTKDIGESVYQGLSNQLSDNRAGMLALAEASAQLGLVTQSEATDGMNMLSSAIRSYNLPVEKAGELTALFFKSVELGRYRIRDVSDSIGTVFAYTSQMGVSIPETMALFDELTQKGMRASVAGTQIRNMVSSLIKASPELQQILLETFGTTTAQAAISKEGWFGFVKKLAEQMDDLKDLSMAFKNMRGFTAATYQFAPNDPEAINKLQKHAETLANSQGALKKAIDIMTNDPSVGYERIKTALDNMMTVGFGESIIRGLQEVSGSEKKFIADMQEVADSMAGSVVSVIKFLKELKDTWDQYMSDMNNPDVEYNNKSAKVMKATIDWFEKEKQKAKEYNKKQMVDAAESYAKYNGVGWPGVASMFRSRYDYLAKQTGETRDPQELLDSLMAARIAEERLAQSQKTLNKLTDVGFLVKYYDTTKDAMKGTLKYAKDIYEQVQLRAEAEAIIAKEQEASKTAAQEQSNLFSMVKGAATNYMNSQKPSLEAMTTLAETWVGKLKGEIQSAESFMKQSETIAEDLKKSSLDTLDTKWEALAKYQSDAASFSQKLNNPLLGKEFQIDKQIENAKSEMEKLIERLQQIQDTPAFGGIGKQMKKHDIREVQREIADYKKTLVTLKQERKKALAEVDPYDPSLIQQQRDFYDEATRRSNSRNTYDPSNLSYLVNQLRQAEAVGDFTNTEFFRNLIVNDKENRDAAISALKASADRQRDLINELKPARDAGIAKQHDSEATTSEKKSAWNMAKKIQELIAEREKLIQEYEDKIYQLQSTGAAEYAAIPSQEEMYTSALNTGLDETNKKVDMLKEGLKEANFKLENMGTLANSLLPVWTSNSGGVNQMAYDMQPGADTLAQMSQMAANTKMQIDQIKQALPEILPQMKAALLGKPITYTSSGSTPLLGNLPIISTTDPVVTANKIMENTLQNNDTLWANNNIGATQALNNLDAMLTMWTRMKNISDQMWYNDLFYGNTWQSLMESAGAPTPQMSYYSRGGSVFSKRGTDTVPAMLTPGEFVINRAASQKYGSLLRAINSGFGVNLKRFIPVQNRGTRYMASGGPVTMNLGGLTYNSRSTAPTREDVITFGRMLEKEAQRGFLNFNRK